PAMRRRPGLGSTSRRRSTVTASPSASARAMTSRPICPSPMTRWCMAYSKCEQCSRNEDLSEQLSHSRGNSTALGLREVDSMSADHPPHSAPRPGSRVAARERTMARIIELGNAQLREHGAAELSVREIARGLGMVSSAIYRYVTSRDE